MMYRWGYGHGLMEGWGPLGLFTWIVLMADLVLIGIWLIKQIQKK